METIWLQRPTSDIPWGFRLQGGRDYGAPLSVQKVNPGSVASGNLTPGDVVLKIGNVNATNITHTDAQEIIKGACNILQLTIKKSPAPAALSPTSYNVNQQPTYQQQQQQQPSYDEYDRYQSLPNYKVGDVYGGPSDRNVSSGYNYAQEKSPYDMRPQEPPQVSGYTTLPVRGSNKENTESFRPVQQQNKYPYKATAGIKLQTNPQTQRPVRDDYDQSGYNYGQMSPVSYQNDYNRQTSGGSQRSGSDNYQPSHFRKPTPFKPGGYDTQNGSVTPPPRMQRQTSSSSQGSNVYESTITPGYQPPGSYRNEPDPDEAPPMPPPPTNYQRQGSGSYGQSPYQQDYQPQQSYQRQTSQGRSPYDDRQAAPQSGYQQPGMYIDTSDRSGSSYGRQGSQPYGSDYPDYRQNQPQQTPDYYGGGNQPTPQRQQSYGAQQPTQPYGGQYTSTPYDRQSSQTQQPAPYGRQSSREQQPQPAPYGRQSSREQQQQPPQSTPYGRQPSRDQNQYPQPYQSPQSGGINSFDEILSPFENFQNSNYCDKLFDRSPDNRLEGDSGIQSDLSEPAYSYQSPSLSSDTPRSNLSYTGYSPPQRDYGSPQQGLLRPAPQAPPPPAVSPPPPPPPPLPPTEWAAPKPSPQRGGMEQEQNGSNPMPDKVLNTMMKHGGTQKPFSYVPTGMDLKKFKEKARQRQQPRNVMPRAYAGPDLEKDEPQQPGAPPNPQTGVYKHSQYNSPLRMYSDQNAKEALNLQAGDDVEVAGVSGTPEKSQSDFKDSEVYRMCKAADKQGKTNDGVPSDQQVPDEERVREQYAHEERVREQQAREPEFVAPASSSRGKGLSFKVLQWLTDTADDENEGEDAESNKPKKPRDPLLRHNSIDDEMRFSGLHSKADIPSKAFQRLNQLSINDDGQEVPAGKEQGEPSEEPSRIGNYDEASIRYRGNYIPSPSFRLLQALSKDDINPKQSSKLASPVRRAIEDDSENDGLPDHLDDAEMVETRYKGSYIPSKAFRCLQRHIKDDEQQQQQQQNAPAEPKSEEKSGPKMNVISRGATDSPKTVPKKTLVPAEEPSTDF